MVGKAFRLSLCITQLRSRLQNTILHPYPFPFFSFFNLCQGMLIKSRPHRRNFIYLSHFSLGHSSPKHSWMLSLGTVAGDKRFICSWHPFCLIWNQASLSPGASCSLCSTLCMGLLVWAATGLNPPSSHCPGGGTDSSVRQGETVETNGRESINLW